MNLRELGSFSHFQIFRTIRDLDLRSSNSLILKFVFCGKALKVSQNDQIRMKT